MPVHFAHLKRVWIDPTMYVRLQVCMYASTYEQTCAGAMDACSVAVHLPMLNRMKILVSYRRVWIDPTMYVRLQLGIYASTYEQPCAGAMDACSVAVHLPMLNRMKILVAKPLLNAPDRHHQLGIYIPSDEKLCLAYAACGSVLGLAL